MISKKGQVEFLPYLLIGLVFVVALAVFAIPITYVGDELFDELKEDDYFNSSEDGESSINQIQNLMTGVTDQLIFFLVGAILIGFIVIAMFSDFHPILVGILFLFIVLMVILGGIMSNLLDEVKDTDTLEEKSEEFTLTNQVLGENLPIFITVFGGVAIIILLAKRGKVVSPV